MFDLSWSHILLVLIVALIVVGPKDLPRLMHTIGRWMGKARAMANEFRKSFDEMARQAELDELRKEIAALRTERPITDIQQHFEHGILPADVTASPDPAQVMMPPEHTIEHATEHAPEHQVEHTPEHTVEHATDAPAKAGTP
jgi:sec-independent protein translocase protein TatB